MQKIKAWALPGYFYIYGERGRRRWLHGLFVWGILVIFGTSIFTNWFYRPQGESLFHLSETASAASESLAPPSPPNNFIGIEEAMKQWVGEQNRGEWSIVVQDLNNTGNHVSINGDEQYYMASIYKLFMTIPLSQKSPFDKWGSQYLWKGYNSKTISGCVDAMLSNSDNPCGEAIGEFVQWHKASQSLEAAGFKGTSLSKLSTNASDTARYLEGLDKNEWFSSETGTFIKNSLGRQKYRLGIPAGCPGCTVLNKTGDLNGVTHDAAIVTSGQAKYVLVIFSRGGNFKQIADLSQLVNNHLTR